jgi:hypothetical protein
VFVPSDRSAERENPGPRPEDGDGFVEIKTDKMPQSDQFENGVDFPLEFGKRIVDRQELVGRRMNGDFRSINIEVATISLALLPTFRPGLGRSESAAWPRP